MLTSCISKRRYKDCPYFESQSMGLTKVVAFALDRDTPGLFVHPPTKGPIQPVSRSLSILHCCVYFPILAFDPETRMTKQTSLPQYSVFFPQTTKSLIIVFCVASWDRWHILFQTQQPTPSTFPRVLVFRNANIDSLLHRSLKKIYFTHGPQLKSDGDL